MQRIIKISLIASLTCFSFLSAKELTQAIKNVDVSGSVVYRYNDYNDDLADSDSTNYYKIGLNVAAKINDAVKFKSRAIAGNDVDGGFKASNTQESGDENIDVSLSHIYFAYSGLKNTVINLGKQGLATPWTVALDVDGNEQTGTGIYAISNYGPISLTAAYFNQTNLDSSGNDKSSFSGASDLYTLGLIGKLSFLTLDAWYMNLEESGLGDGSNSSNGLGFDSYTLGALAKYTLAGINFGLDIRYTNLEFQSERASTSSKENSLFDVGLTAKYSIFNAHLQYLKSGKDGGLTALDQHATTSFTVWNVNIQDKIDADLYRYTIGAQILSPLHILVTYVDLEHEEASKEAKEETLYTQATYKMSKNLSTYIRYGTYEKKVDGKKENDELRGRLQIMYTY